MIRENLERFSSLRAEEAWLSFGRDSAYRQSGLYKTSGHYPYYKDAVSRRLKLDGEEYLLKPMNCPHHHQIYSSKPRVYRDLPIGWQSSERLSL